MGVALENIRREKVSDSRNLGKSREELKHFTDLEAYEKPPLTNQG